VGFSLRKGAGSSENKRKSTGNRGCGAPAIVARIERKALPASRFGRYGRKGMEHTLGSPQRNTQVS
jgi:hypothetical protein